MWRGMENKMIAKPHPGSLKHWLPLAVLLGLIALSYGLGFQHYLTLQSIAEHQGELQTFVTHHLLAAVLIYCTVYILVVSLSLPGAGILSILGGFVFGWVISAPVTVVAATIGAVLVFKIVQTSLGVAIAGRAGPLVQKFSAGFAEDGFNYLLFLRLVPAFPFCAVNAVAGLTKMKLRTFTIATVVGIIPGAVAFAWLGRGLGSVIDAQRSAHDACVVQNGAANCPFEISVSSLVTRELLIAFAILGIVSLIPVAIKKWKNQ
jgi:uncharacterized membrane protein YdjX (TVP38/TMEM64 family)